jgi:hypothetical protein
VRVRTRLRQPECNRISVRRVLLLTLFLVLLPGLSEGAVKKQQNHPYRKSLKHETLGKPAMGRVAASAGVAQLRKKPSKYGSGAKGFGKRLGAGFATNAVNQTVKHGVAAKLHEDLHYQRSNKKGVGPRLGYALKSTVITRNTKTGKGTPAAGRIAGHAAAGAFTQGVLAAGSGASTAGVGLAADAGANIVREFVPRRKHRTGQKR